MIIGLIGLVAGGAPLPAPGNGLLLKHFLTWKERELEILPFTVTCTHAHLQVQFRSCSLLLLHLQRILPSSVLKVILISFGCHPVN